MFYLVFFLDLDEQLVISSEDLKSCFNLFYLPEAWHGYFAFSKQVQASVFGGSPNIWVYVAIRCVPMGWLNAVDVIQNFIHRFAFQTCDIPPHLEARKDKPPPKGDAVVVCMDGFDYVRRVNKALSEQVLGKENMRNPEMARFARECELRKFSST